MSRWKANPGHAFVWTRIHAPGSKQQWPGCSSQREGHSRRIHQRTWHDGVQRGEFRTMCFKKNMIPVSVTYGLLHWKDHRFVWNPQWSYFLDPGFLVWEVLCRISGTVILPMHWEKKYGKNTMVIWFSKSVLYEREIVYWILRYVNKFIVPKSKLFKNTLNP